MARPAQDQRQRFLKYVAPAENGCHIWTAQITSFGYGAFSQYGKGKKRAHRVAYELFVGQIPEGMCVLHKCDVRACVNPDHLFLGTVIDNIKDMDRKGRRSAAYKLGKEKAETAMEALNMGIPQQFIANSLGVHQGTISRLKLEKIKHYLKEV